MKGRRFNWVLSDYIRKGIKFYMEWSARLRGQRFACRALAGESEYNLTINCDQTVSCNCQDYNGSGHIGDLKKSSFEEVFFGEAAWRLRSELAKGKLPISSCTRCGDLMRVPKSDVKLAANRRNGQNGPAKGGGKPETIAATPSTTAVDSPQVYAGPIPRLPYRGMLLENTVRCNID